MIHRHVECPEVEVLVAVRFDVLVEQDPIGGSIGRRTAMVDGVALVLGGGGDVPPRTELDRCRQVGLLHSGSDLAEDGLDRVGVGLEEPFGGSVLGFEIGEQVGVVDLAHPGIRVVDVAGRTLPGVGPLRGAWRGGGVVVL